MINLNTNLSSLITQNSLKQSTNRLNVAIERMTTGFKINHAKDNAANYNITTNMTTKIGAYMVAEDNCAMGLNLISTAEGSLNTISDKLSRLRALAVQTQNGTYGGKSLEAINQEAESIVAEIKREYTTTEYNGLKLFNVEKEALEAQETAFIEDPVTYDQAYVDNLTAVSSVTGSFTESEYKIAEVKDLVALATLTNSGVSTFGVKFILAKDLDIGAYCDEQLANGNGGWTPIGNDTKTFAGNFDGNGHVIKNLKIDRSADYQGLFGYAVSYSTIKNIAIVDGYINGGAYVGSLVGYANSASIRNCYATSKVSGIADNVGGLIGELYSNSRNPFTNCFASGEVYGINHVGGLVGSLNLNKTDSISNCYATGKVNGNNYVGGLVGYVYNDTWKDSITISKCYATGTVSGNNYVGGLIGYADLDHFRSVLINETYSTGNVIGNGNYIGGLIGLMTDYSGPSCKITNSYAAGDVTGNKYVGGFVGMSEGTITNCYATGNVTGNEDVGGFTGCSYFHLSSCYAAGNVSGNKYIGGFVGGIASANTSISDCYATGNITGSENVGGFTGESPYGSFGANASIQSDSKATQMSIDEIKTKYTPEYMGFTESNGWKIVEEKPRFLWEKVEDTSSDSGAEEEGVNLDGANVVSFQVGVNSGASSGMSFDLAFSLIEIDDVMALGLADSGCLSLLDSMILRVSDKAIEYGAMQNRLESALDEISVQYENLVSSRSTLRDADIAEVSSEYIRQQILQQASATLMATANQSPSIALQLI